MPADRQPIGIVAGGGGFVPELLQHLAQVDQPVYVAAIHGEAAPTLAGTHLRWFSWGEIGRMVKFFKTHNCRDLLLIGSIKKRPDLLSVVSDPGTLVRIPKIVSAISSGGDDSILRRVISLIEADDFKVVGLGDVAPDFLAPVGILTKAKLTQADQTNLTQAKAVLKDLGPHDIGQGVVVIGGRIVAVEGAEGTDAMLERVRTIRQEGRISKGVKGGLFVKATKAGQDLRVDLPTMGPRTVERAHAAGLSGIVVEATKVIVLNKQEVIRLATAYNLVVVGETGF